MYPLRQNLVSSAPLHTVLGKFRLQNALLAEEYRQQGGADPAAGEVMPSREYTGGGAGLLQHQVSFCRYRFCATGELKYRGAVGLGYRSTYKRTLFVNYKILLLKLYGFAKIKSKSC